jgi:putative glutamine amidotransferase
MLRKPLIGINSDYRTAQKGVPALSVVFAGYYDSLLQAGALPVVIPPYPDDKNLDAHLEQIISMLDGIVMVGGGDLDPRRDGFMLHSSVKLLDERRETFDRFLIEKVAEHRDPLSCSSFLLSRKCNILAILVDIFPFEEIKRSTSVVFP